MAKSERTAYRYFFCEVQQYYQYDMPEITVFGCGNMTRLVRRAHTRYVYTAYESIHSAVEM